MTKAVAIIHDDIWQETLGLLSYDKGTVTVLRRDAEWAAGQTGVTFVENGEPYEIQKTETGGGYVEIGMINNWHIVMLASKPANLQAINQLNANKVLGLAILQTDEDGSVSGWESVLDEEDRAKISTWMENNGYGAIPEGATARQATRLVWRVINAELDENSFDIAD